MAFPHLLPLMLALPARKATFYKTAAEESFQVRTKMLLKMPEEASFALEAMHGVIEAMLMSSGTVPSELQQAAMDPFKKLHGFMTASEQSAS